MSTAGQLIMDNTVKFIAFFASSVNRGIRKMRNSILLEIRSDITARPTPIGCECDKDNCVGVDDFVEMSQTMLICKLSDFP